MSCSNVAPVVGCDTSYASNCELELGVAVGLEFTLVTVRVQGFEFEFEGG